MDSIAIAYVLNCKEEKIKNLSPERERLQSEIAILHKLYKQALEDY